MLLLLNPDFSARYPDLGGEPGRALWIAFACAVAMILWRALSGKTKVAKSKEGLVLLGANRRELIREAGISLVLQVILPLTLLAVVCQQRVVVLFDPRRGAPEAFGVTGGKLRYDAIGFPHGDHHKPGVTLWCMESRSCSTKPFGGALPKSINIINTNPFYEKSSFRYITGYCCWCSRCLVDAYTKPRLGC